MPPSTLRSKIDSGYPVIGPLLQEVPDSCDLVEFIGRAGFDYVIVDSEHAGTDIAWARQMARAADASGMSSLARVPNADPGRILALLDAGIEGIILAHCNSVDDAEGLVRSTKYPPRGVRGAAAGSRAAMFGYGSSPRDKLDSADADTLCLGLIEEPRAVDEVEGMLAVDGFDGCFIGPGDMALAMGRDFYGHASTHPSVQELVDRTRDATLKVGKLVMEPSGTGVGARELINKGVHLVVVQFGQLLRHAFDSYLTEARTKSS